MISLKNQMGGFDVGLGVDLRQQLLDEEESRKQQMAASQRPGSGFGGSSMNLASLELFGKGGSLGG